MPSTGVEVAEILKRLRYVRVDLIKTFELLEKLPPAMVSEHSDDLGLFSIREDIDGLYELLREKMSVNE